MPFVPLQNQNRTQTQFGATPGFKPLNQSPALLFKGTSGIVNPAVEATLQKQEKQISNQASLDLENKKKQNELQQNQDFLSSISLNGKSYNDLTFEDVAKSMGGNMAAAKSFIDLRNAFNSANKDQKVEAALAGIKTLVKISEDIPSVPGLQGQIVTPVTNYIMQKSGYLPAKSSFDETANLFAPLIRRAFGDDKINALDQETGGNFLRMIAAPNKNLREYHINTINNVLSDAIGKKIDVGSSSFESSANYQKQQNSSEKNSGEIKFLGFE